MFCASRAARLVRQGAAWQRLAAVCTRSSQPTAHVPAVASGLAVRPLWPLPGAVRRLATGAEALAADEPPLPPSSLLSAALADPPPSSRSSTSATSTTSSGSPLGPSPSPSPPSPPPSLDSTTFAEMGVSQAQHEALVKRGLLHPTEVQRATFTSIRAGHDVLVRSRTGTGKTLAFALPVVEELLAEARPQQGGRPTRGAAPRALVITPTRELALQVEGEFARLTRGTPLQTLVVYGGASMGDQQRRLRQGVDVVIGTPGRLTDHLAQQTLDLSQCRFVTLDEADRMLEIGFEQDVEKILAACPAPASADAGPAEGGRQTLLFSATMPGWVRRIAQRYMSPDFRLLDLVGDEKLKCSELVRHVAIAAEQVDDSLLRDTVAHYMRRKAIVFTNTKSEADRLARMFGPECQVLHGDITQHMREVTTAAFRRGDFKVLLATDVAARGLDVPDVDLVVQVDVPRRKGTSDLEAYVHRSGRTGRAGSSGTSVVFYPRPTARDLGHLERQLGFTFERRGPVKPEEIMEHAARDAAARLDSVHADVLPFFADTADRLLRENGSAALAAALAALVGRHRAPDDRSLFNGKLGRTTLLIRPSSASIFMDAQAVTDNIRALLADHSVPHKALGRPVPCLGTSFALDVDTPLARKLLATAKAAPDCNLVVEKPTELPLQLRQKAAHRGNDSNNSGSGGGGSGSRKRFGGHGRQGRDRDRGRDRDMWARGGDRPTGRRGRGGHRDGSGARPRRDDRRRSRSNDADPASFRFGKVY